ncbi:MAG: PHB depolymerase family esterase [Thermodesulfobacteriota bacterium]
MHSTETRLMVLTLALLALLAVAACVNREAPDKPRPNPQPPISGLTGPGDYERSLVVDGMERSFTLHVPTSYDGKRPMAVVLNFHGGGGNSKTQRHISRMDATADREGFIVVYPQGTNEKSLIKNGYTWNAGTCCGWAQEHNIDDVRFTGLMLDRLEKEFVVDTKRIYATGISNGALMCYRLACELADRIAAIAPIAGPMGMDRCRPSRPVSIMHFHGTDDKFAPYSGGVGDRSLPGQHFESVQNTVDFWVRAQGLREEQNREFTPRATVRYQRFLSDKAEFVLVTLEGGGHTWPGGQFGFLGKRFLGEMNQEISASDSMWEFFKRHPLP